MAEVAPGAVDQGEAEARPNEAVGVIEHLTESDRLLADGDSPGELPLLAEGPGQECPGSHHREPRQPEVLARLRAFKPPDDRPERFLSLPVVARIVIANAKSVSGPDLEAEVPETVGDVERSLGESSRLRGVARH